jgi:gamma-glutamyl hercynylcysteine S-oxide synthase
MVKNFTISWQKQQLRQWFAQSRSSTLDLLTDLDREIFCTQAHPDFSPVGWHLGHIGYTESLWLLRRCAGLSPVEPTYDRLFAADSLPKQERTSLPAYSEICDYLDRIRQNVFSYLEQLTSTELQKQERLWRWLLQHESQHGETIALVLQMLQMLGHAQTAKITKNSPQCESQAKICDPEMVQIPAGNFVQGYDAIDALDNEQGEHQVYLPSYWIDRYPVTRGAYQAFIDAGGYSQKRWWSEAGWHWLEHYQNPLIAGRSPQPSQPLYWQSWPANDSHPVCGVNWYEAEAYARFCGKRLPTEAEWEKAARWNPATNQSQLYPWGNTSDVFSNALPCNYNQHFDMTTPVGAFPSGQSAYGCYDMLGNVWEWTASMFQDYPGFTSFPYAGYSSSYFDRQHFVLKGGSWATRPWALRASFRNWYHPHVRQIFAGFRCARDV